MRPVFRLAAAAILCAAGRALPAQDALGTCAKPDSVAFRGNTHLSTDILVQEVTITRGQLLSARGLKRAVEALYATSQFDDVEVSCLLPPAAAKTTILFVVKERPLLRNIDLTGVEHVSSSSVREKIDLLVGRPVDPSQIRHAISKIDSIYMDAGYYLARVYVDTVKAGTDVDLTFRVDEGRRLSISGIEIVGNETISEKEIVKAMAIKPEGFFWWKKGEFDDDKYASDLVEGIPALYAQKGFIDMQIVHDTVIVNRELGKAYLRLTLREGKQYRVGTFEVNGSKHFAAEDIARFYPFTEVAGGVGDFVRGVFRARSENEQIFDESLWIMATGRVRDAYQNEGYLYANVEPVIERSSVGADSIPTVNLRWEVRESSPAIVNRIDFTGNDFTTERCIRDQVFLLPGDVFNKDAFLRSLQNIGNLGFFETPMDDPDVKPRENGDVDITIKVKEKKTGAVNFGASVGQGTGLGGFIGFEQPNLFGLCKRGSLQWQFGQYVNDFSLSYSDPRIRGSRVSGFVTAYNSRSQFIIQDLGRTTRTGGQVKFGFPLPNSRQTRLYFDYGGEQVQYGDEGLVGTIPCRSCFRSTVGTSLEHDTRLGLPFPIAGIREVISAQFNGGPLGGSSSFSRYSGEIRTASTLARLGSKGITGEPMILAFNLSVRAGALFGDPGPFFVSQSFSLGGTQYGEVLRGYDEFSITPGGFVPNASQYQAQRASFGNAFFATTAEIGLRVSQQMFVSWFYDAGNLWARPKDFDPTRLFRGSGFGALIVTPLGPLGIDLGYGFDRLDLFGRKAPKWQAHFKFGQY